MSQPRFAIIGAGTARVEAIPPSGRSTVLAMRNPARGLVLLVASVVGLAAEIVSTVQDGISGAKVIALACFLFLFWYGWDLREKARRKAQKPKAL